MKRLKFKKPFNGMDNAKKLIPESYKVDGNEFEITDGNETYRIKWSSLINEGIILTSSNKARINEDMSKIKHLMGFKSQETLGTVKGAARLDENKKFGDVLDKTKNLLNEEANENLELKSLAKKIYLGFKKMGARVSLTDANTVKDIGAERGNTDNADVFVYINNDLTFGDTVGVVLVGDKAIGEKDKIKNSFKEFEFTEIQGGNTWKGKKTVHLTIRPGKSVSENEHIKSGMGGSNKGKSRTEKTEYLKKNSKKGRRKADKEATKDINEDDVANFQDALGSNPKVVNAAKKINTPIEKIEAAVNFINNMAGDDDALIGKIIRAIRKDGSDAVNEFDGDEDEYEHYRRGGRELDDYLDDAEKEAKRAKEAGIFKDDLPPGPSDEEEQAAQVYEDESEEYYDFDDTTTSIEGEPGYNQSDINPIDTDLLSQIDSPDTMAGRKARKAGKSDVQKNYSQPKKGIHPLDPRKHALPYDLDSYGPNDSTTPPSEKEAQTSTASGDRYPYRNYGDRFDEVFEGMYEEEDLNEVVSFEDTKYAEEFDDYDDSFYAAKKAWEVKRIPKVKAKVIKMANELNNMISIKDGYGDDVVIKWYDSNAIFNEVEFDENQMTVSYRDYYDRKSDVETYDLNDYSVYEDGLYDDNLMQVLKKAIKGYKKKTSNIQNKTNFYPYYTVDMDDKRILDAFETKEDAIYSKKDLSEPSVKIINIKGLERLNLKPINIGS